jgi:hypothetical protein
LRSTAFIAGLLIVGALSRTAATPPQAQASTTMTIDAVAHRVMQAEAALTSRMKAFHPIVEVYVQHVETREPLGSVPVSDDYFLGQYDSTDLQGPKMTRLTPEKSGRRMTDWISRPFGLQLNFDGFAAMTVPDWRLLNDQQHTFTFLRNEFLGEVRCVVFDVAPRVDSGNGFTGRIWVEDRDFNIVRFNGITRSPGLGKAVWFSVDSWRANVKPGLWLPSYVFSELHSDEGPRIKSHVRLWGYYLKAYRSTQESESILERLSQAGLLAPPGQVDKVLETVINNLQITNNLTIQPLATRVLLTTPLESFTIGRTIVLSRGLIDVLPDEASLATMLAHELAHIILGHRGTDPQLATAVPPIVADDELLATIVPRYTLAEEGAADDLMIELLKNSPYKDKLSDAGLFLRAVSENAKKLTNLIPSHFADYTSNQGQLRRLSELIQKSPALSPERLDQVAALPLGARVVVDPWTGRVELISAANVPLAAAREKASMSVTPLVPYLRYVDADVKQ